MLASVVKLLAAAAVASAATSGCTLRCGPNSTACNRCLSNNCNFTAGVTEYFVDFDRVGLCAPGFYPTTYPLCVNTTTATTSPISYSCSADMDDLRDSRMLQYAARLRKMAYAISPLLPACKHSCSDVGLEFGTRDAELNAICGDCVPSSALVIGSSEIVAVRVPSTSDGRSASVWGMNSFPGAPPSLLQRSREASAAQAEQSFEARRVYVCRDKTQRGVDSCLRELRARGLVDTSVMCYDGTQSVLCPRGGSGHKAVEWASRFVALAGVIALIISLHWWMIPLVQLVPAAFTWCNEGSSLIRALYQGSDIILLKWDWISDCPVGFTATGCEIINVAISALVLFVCSILLAILTHALSWVAAGNLSDAEKPPPTGVASRIASRPFRLTFGGAMALWAFLCLIPLAHFSASVLFSASTDEYGDAAWWIFALMGIGFLVLAVILVAIAFAVSVLAAARVSREVRGLASHSSTSAPVIAQTPYGEVVSAVGGYSPLYRAYVGHVHGPASLVSATAALWNSGWWNWFPSGEPLAWSTFEGLYDGDSGLVRQFGCIYNSFNPSNIMFGAFSYIFYVLLAVVVGAECLYVDEKMSCCVVRAVVGVAVTASVFLGYLIRRPLLGDNVLPALLLLIVGVTWIVYLIVLAADAADEVGPQVAVVSLAFVTYGVALMLGLLHSVVRFAHAVMADGSAQAVTTVAVDMNDRKAVATLVGMEPGASYIATTQQQGGLVSVPTFYGNGNVVAPGSEGIPAPSPHQHPMAGSVAGSQMDQSQHSPVYYPHPQQVQNQAPQPEVPKDGNWVYTDGDEWPVESSYTIISQ